MSVVLEREFATAEDTAKVLGVSKTRLRRLLRIAGPQSGEATPLRYTAKSGNKRAVPAAKRRKQTRGKAKKAAR